ncbi:hypothetical protein ACFPRL_26390 [Pseudoclavibacter helvolus]
METPSFVIVGAPHFFSSTTLRPRGPSVTLTASASVFSPRSSPRRASSSKAMIFDICVLRPFRTWFVRFVVGTRTRRVQVHIGTRPCRVQATPAPSRCGRTTRGNHASHTQKRRRPFQGSTPFLAAGQSARTDSAWGPLSPAPISNSTFCPSSRTR